MSRNADHIKATADQRVAKKVNARRNPDQLFTVMQLSRASIAEQINIGIELRGLGAEQSVKEDDDRLTDEVCAEFADDYGEMLNDGMVDTYDEDQWREAEAALSARWLMKLGILAEEAE